MEAFVHRHQPLIISVMYLVFGLLVFGYSAFYSTQTAWRSDALVLNSILTTENQTMQVAARKLDGDGTKFKIKSLPSVLSRLNNLAKQTEIIIHELTPDTEDQATFNIRLIESYAKLLKFLSLLESLDVSIHNIEIHPYDTSVSPPIHAISFSVTPKNDAARLQGDRILKLSQRVGQPNKRNPFQRFAASSIGKIEKVIDLSWVHKLSGIGRIGDQRYATIDSKDYQQGDEFRKGVIVEKIASSIVRLVKKDANGTVRYVLKFRKKKKNK
ncbi:MAG: hypothetical protein COB46_05905 [Rhodospirillaceae bacterium]|nr:MAG: hypothetical protein COB46_05905 [Rhodospirillaceae bacterium]